MNIFSQLVVKVVNYLCKYECRLELRECRDVIRCPLLRPPPSRRVCVPFELAVL